MHTLPRKVKKTNVAIQTIQGSFPQRLLWSSNAVGYTQTNAKPHVSGNFATSGAKVQGLLRVAQQNTKATFGRQRVVSEKHHSEIHSISLYTLGPPLMLFWNVCHKFPRVAQQNRNKNEIWIRNFYNLSSIVARVEKIVQLE